MNLVVYIWSEACSLNGLIDIDLLGSNSSALVEGFLVLTWNPDILGAPGCVAVSELGPNDVAANPRVIVYISGVISLL